MGSLNFFWITESVDIKAKYLIYIDIPLHLLTFECESWSLTKILIQKLEVFHTKCIRKKIENKMDSRYQTKNQKIFCNEK